jgi:hypothetical protein
MALKQFGGITTESWASYSANTGNVVASGWQSSLSGVVDSVGVYSGVSSGNFKFAIYKGGSSLFDAAAPKLQTTGALSVDTADDWNVRNISSPFSVSSGDWIHLVKGQETANIRSVFSDPGANSRYSAAYNYTTMGSLPDPFGASWTSPGNYAYGFRFYGYTPPVIVSVNGGASINGTDTGIAVVATDLVDSAGDSELWLCSTNDFSTAPIKVAQTINGIDDTSIDFDVVPGDLFSGTVYAFAVSALGQVSDPVAVTLVVAPLPEISGVGESGAVSRLAKSVPVVGIHLGDEVWLANNADFDAATIKVQQVTRYMFSTLAVFDVTPGALADGTVYVFSRDGDLINATGYPVTLYAETMPSSTVAADAAETLTTQFDNANLTKGFLEALLSPFDEIDSALQYLDTEASFLHGAKGAWLDSEGQIIGAKREAMSIPEELFFTFGPSREGGPTAKSYTQGFDGGYLRSRFGNPLAGTQKGDTAYTDYLYAKSLATFRGTSLCDLIDFVFELFGVVCAAEFTEYSDVILTPDEPLSYAQKLVIQKYAPVSAGSNLTIVEGA